jgi:hypothetical protein
MKKDIDQKRRELWKSFIQSKDKLVSVVAARRTGKSTAVIQKALQHKENTYIVYSHRFTKELNLQKMIEWLNQNKIHATVHFRPGQPTELDLKDFKIYMTYIDRLVEVMAQENFAKKVHWIFEEPELFDETLEYMDSIDMFDHALSVTLIGTYQTKKDTFAKQFHQLAEKEGYAQVIDIYDSGLFSSKEIREIKKWYSNPELFELECLCLKPRKNKILNFMKSTYHNIFPSLS